MFQLFKKRTFSSYINDTFDFFKVEGKNYIKNYFLINGGFLVLMLICFYFVFQFYFDIIKQQSYGFDSDYFINYMGENPFLIFFFALLLFSLSVIFSAISYSYPTLYLKNMEKYPGKTITTEMIITELKQHFGRILIYLLGLFFIVFPLIMIAFGFSVVLIFIIIGIPILILLFPTALSVVMLSYNDYLIKETSFFGSIGVAIKMIKKNFWPIVGSTFIMYMILQIVTTIFTAIPQMMMMFQLFTSLESKVDYTQSTEYSILYLITIIISMVAGFILNNLILINQGLIYYSEREVLENNQSRFDIEQLGQHNE